MPAQTYRITSPDGDTYDVTPPEGTAEKDILPTFMAHLSAQQAAAGAPDVAVPVPAKGSRPARTLNVPAWAQTMAGQATGETVAPETLPSTPAAPPRRLGLAEAAGQTMASGEQRVEDILSELTRPAQLPGEETVTGALKRSGRALAGIGANVVPTGNVGQVIGGTQARMRGQSPEDVATAEERGGMVGAAAPLGLTLGAKAAMRLLPGARGATAVARTLAGRGLENLGAGVGQAGQLAEQGTAGTAAAETAGDIAGRLTAKAGEEASKAASAERAFGTRAARQAEAAGKPMTAADYPKTFLALRRQNEAVAQAAVDFNRQVTQKIANLGPSNLSTRLAKDPDLLSGLLRHATPEEAGIIQRAVLAGKPMSTMPWTADQLSGVGESALQGKGIFGFFSHHPLGTALGGIAGERMLGPVIGSHPFAAATVTAGTLALKGIDALAGSRKGYALLKWIAQAPVGSLAAQAGMRKLGDMVGGPRELEPPLVHRQMGGPVAAGQKAIVGEAGPEVIQAQQPIDVAPTGMMPGKGGGWVPQGTIPTPTTIPSGLSRGTQGLSDEDAQRAQRGFTIIMGPNGPVAVPR